MKPDLKFLRILSDIHLEQYLGMPIAKVVDRYVPEDILDEESILVLAGDICSKGDYLIDFIKAVKDRFIHTLFVAGNHEWYRHEIKSYTEELTSAFSKMDNITVSIMDVNSISIQGREFILGTLWGDGGKSVIEQFDINCALNDFKVVQLGHRRFNVDDMMEIAKEQKQIIKEKLQASEAKKIVITHHMPSYALCHPRFGHAINGGFANNCDDIINSDFAPDIWICGHTHDTFDRVLNNTRFICNPLGYRFEQTDNPFNKFSNRLFIEV
jgi:predicted phosphodiesterase